MGIFVEYNKFVADYGDLCRAAGITPRQALILVAAMQEYCSPTHGGKVYLPLQFPDATVVTSGDPDLLDLMTEEKPFLQWGDSECRSVVITVSGRDFVMSHTEIFASLIPDLLQEKERKG